jgi:hypothetical protein
MKEEREELKLGKLPEGNRLLKYCRELDEIIKNNPDSFLHFVKRLYGDCKNFLLNTKRVWGFPMMTLKLVPTHAEYLADEMRENAGAIQKEVPIGLSYGFTVNNPFIKRTYIDMELHIELLQHNAETFITGLVETYFHELFHCAFGNIDEQKAYEMQCSAVEDFLGIKYPSHVKNRKASDYYKSVWSGR